MNKPILSICIPTFNRRLYLKDTLDNLIKQVHMFGDQVEICVSDNASDDGTSELMHEIVKTYRQVKYYANSVNYGYDYNIIKLIEVSQGEYIWFLSDDDVVATNAVKQIISFITKSRCSCYYIKPIFFKDNFDLEILNPSFGVIDDKEIALKNVSWLVSFVSSFILKRDLAYEDISNFLGYGFIHTPFVLEAIAAGKTGFIDRGFLYVRQGNGGGYNKYKYFGEYFSSIVSYFIGDNYFAEQTIEKVLCDWINVVVLSNVIEDKIKNRFNLIEGMKLWFYYRKIKGCSLRLLVHVLMPAGYYKKRRKK